MSGDISQSSVRVVVRVRPENPAELQCQLSSDTVIRVLDDYCLIFDPNEEEDSFIRDNKTNDLRYGPKKKCRDIRFAFDRVFEGNCRQEEVYLGTTKGVVERAMRGINCSMFAYGATGAGKTYTMLGSSEEPGVTFRTVKELFDVIDSKQDELNCDVKVSYLEVYNETIHDLLKPSGVLVVREDPEKGVCIKGLSFCKPESASELLEMLRRGNEKRTQHPTDANSQSSRSHAVFQVYVRQKPRTAGLSTQVKVAKISLIDLAGSERATMTTNRGMRLREGANINRSLLALGNCINALADRNTENKRTTYVPYRDSKLTRLLKDSLGGNCFTVMVANISPSRSSYEDTYNTLKYAQRAKSIKSKLSANTMNVDIHVSKYRSIIEGLQAENNDLKLRLQTVPAGVPAVTEITENSVIDEALRQRIESELSPFNSVTSACLDLTDIEAAERDAMAKGLRKERNIQRMTAIGRSSTECVTKWQAALSTIRDRQSSLANRQKELLQQKQTAEQQLKQNVAELGLGSFSLNSAHSLECNTMAKLMVRNHQLEKEQAVLTRQLKHCRQFMKAQNKASQNTEKLIQHFCNYTACVSNYFTSAAGSMPLTLQTEFENLIRLIEGSGKELAWADQSTNSGTKIIPLKQPPVNQCREQPTHFNVQTPAIATTSGILTPSVKKMTEVCVAAGEQSLFGDRLPFSNETGTCFGASATKVSVNKPVAMAATPTQNGNSNMHRGPCISSAKKLAVERADNITDGSDSVKSNGQQSLSVASLPKKALLLPPPPRVRTPRRPRRRGTFTVHNPINLSSRTEPNSQDSTNNWAMNTDPTALESLFKPLVCPSTPKTTPSRRIITRRTPNSKSLLGSKSPLAAKESGKSNLPQRVLIKKKSRGGDGDVENQSMPVRSRVVGGVKRPHDGSVMHPAKRANVTGNSLTKKRGQQAGGQPQPSTPVRREWHVWN